MFLAKNDTQAAEPKKADVRRTSRFNMHSCYYSSDQLEKISIWYEGWQKERCFFHHTSSGKNERTRG